MKTRITEMLGIETPIICGGMMRVGTAELAAAASNAGALGVMTALTQPTPEGLAAEIAKCQSLTSKPFAVNLTVGVVASEINYDDYVDVIINSGVKIVETAGRSPEPFMERFKAAGIKVVHKCVAVRHALKAERIGVDVVSIDGFECAGHPGEQDVGGLVLFPAATQALSIPVLASGGIADGRGLAAALSLGCEGINMGTRFLVTQEAPIHEGIKQKVVEMDENQTRLIFRSYRNTARVYKNTIADEVAEIEAAGGDFGQVHHLVSGANQEKAWSTGDIDAGMVTVGMCGGLIHDIPTCEELVKNIMSDAEAIICDRLAGMVAG
ncbi:oxidoreductase, 2-nitropropane dioxygenase family [marine gamma proteobacterium HTCC2148]|jgi:NAD(P)H-dependent flavin oxidoreductase YrpB (nitropropane dioxygenase family)|uniref:Nitronate monooxygenase n=1 Tax=Candidatus Seongchinamella marina TaxID=2518990 RepID=A0ABT3SRL9_9GAMM|nr:nitronate monooxygenase [Candidatus Seongchinamella marina]EEB80532.1 oxidoreductase, 2-nitropropane dioxygenase family [marine gamma proteobacterium HTCC2148]MBT6124242.1 nitronate monooxygenase [Halieaceae bacterium]MCX2972618.1 nitronate monooxygenase [Candidatus Seongchinamella marina]